MFRINSEYFLPTTILFLIEVYIAIFVRDNFVRPYVGDFLVVIFLYCFLRCFLDIAIWKAGLAVLLFSFLVELTQYYQLIKHLGLQRSWLANVILGSGFEWLDLLAYVLGIALVLMIERQRTKRSGSKLTTDH